MVLAIAIVSVTVCVQLCVVRLVYITCTLIYIQEYTFIQKISDYLHWLLHTVSDHRSSR